jgi:UDP-N-acetyl-D-mannosaminuronic acid dehydrogenase
MNEMDLQIARRSGYGSDAADVTVVGGGGHVGIPLVLAFAEQGLRVNVNDINEATLEILKSGRLPFIEYGAADMLTRALAADRLVFTTSPSQISTKGPVIITIGTPIDEFLNPIRQVVQDCIDVLLPHIGDDQLIVLRSTLFPGTTDWVDSYLKRRGRRNKVAFCPERVVQGYGVKELREMPQIISGTTPEAEEEAAALFGPLVQELVLVKPMEAELAKLFNNAYRYIEFATTNQFYLITKAAGLDYHTVLKAMKHNYPRARNVPRPGYAAGPCLVKDTMQLAAFARNQFSLGNAAMMVNEGLVIHVVEELRHKFDLANMSVGLLGMAFKADIDDTRASLSYKFKKMLVTLAREVLTTDPFVSTDPALRPLDEVIAASDILILCTPHACYKDVDLKNKPVVDVWGFFASANFVH